jgi:hypothetical protein
MAYPLYIHKYIHPGLEGRPVLDSTDPGVSGSNRARDMILFPVVSCIVVWWSKPHDNFIVHPRIFAACRMKIEKMYEVIHGCHAVSQSIVRLLSFLKEKCRLMRSQRSLCIPLSPFLLLNQLNRLSQILLRTVCHWRSSKPSCTF